jgi:lysozyme
MTENKKIVTGIVVATIIIMILTRKKIATYLNKTPFGSISDKLFNLISRLEGFVAVPYWDSKQWSVGYGSGYNWDAKRPVNKTDIIDKATANRWLLAEAQQEYDFVKSIVKVPLTDNQLIALSSFSYNIGQQALKDSTLMKMLNGKIDKQLVSREFDRWVYSDGKINQGLVNRRKAEKEIFLTPF